MVEIPPFLIYITMKKTAVMLIVAIIIATGIEIYLSINRELVHYTTVTYIFIVTLIVQVVCGFILVDIYKNRKK